MKRTVNEPGTLANAIAAHSGFSATRRSVLTGAAALGATVVAANVAKAGVPSMLVSGGAVSSGSFLTTADLVSLQGVAVGLASATKGGGPVLELGPYQSIGVRKDPIRQVLGVRSQPLVVEFENGMAAQWYQTIAAATSIATAGARHGGEILTIAANGAVSGRLSFQDAVITDILLPKMDASSREPATFSVTFQPAASQYDPRTGSIAPPAGKAAAKRLLRDAFRLQIPGVDDAAFVKSIDSIKIRTTFDQPGRGGPAQAVGVEIGNIVLRVPPGRSASFHKWFDEFARQPSPDKMRSGKLEYQLQTRTAVLGTVDLERLAILRVSTERSSNGELNDTEIELYCEGLKLNLGGFA